MDPARLQQLPSSVINCATVIILVTISTTAQFQQNLQTFHPGFIHPQNSENVYQFPQASQSLNYAPIPHPIHQPQSIPNTDAYPSSQPQTIVNPQWIPNSVGHFYSSPIHVFPSWNQQQMPMSSQGFPNLVLEVNRFGILHHPTQIQIQQHPITQFLHPQEASHERRVESFTFSRRTQTSRNPHLAKLKILAARQERMKRRHLARLRSFYHQQQIWQQHQLRLQEFSHRGTYGAGLQIPQQALTNPGQGFKTNVPFPMSQIYSLWKSQELQRAHRRLQMQNHHQIPHVQQQNHHRQYPKLSYPTSIQEILQQQSPVPQTNQNTLEGQYPSVHQQSLNPIYPLQQDYSTIPMEQNLPPQVHFHPHPIQQRWPPKRPRQTWSKTPRRKHPVRSYPVGHPVGHSRIQIYNGHPHHRGVAIRQSSMSLASAGLGTLFSTLWEIMETLIGSISLFLYVVYSAVSVPLG